MIGILFVYSDLKKNPPPQFFFIIFILNLEAGIFLGMRAWFLCLPEIAAVLGLGCQRRPVCRRRPVCPAATALKSAVAVI